MEDDTTPPKRRKLSASRGGNLVESEYQSGFPDTPMSLQMPVDTNNADLAEAECNTTSELSDIFEGRKLSHVQIPRPCLPAVTFTSWEVELHEAISESDAIHRFNSYLGGYSTEEGNSYLELENFSIYRAPSGKRARDLCTLDKLKVSHGVDSLCFSGILSNGKSKLFIQDIEFDTLTIDGYGDTDCRTMRDKICIQSPGAAGFSVWYRLGRPSKEYTGFHKPFMWLATFTKFFVDFLIAKRDVDITLSLFRSKFTFWVIKTYGSYSFFQSWHLQCGLQKDFGTSVAAYVLFLYKECYSIDESELKLLKQSIWGEIYPLNLTAIDRQDSKDEKEMTVVTPFVYRCFTGMYFAAHLDIKQPCHEALEKITALKRERCLTPWNAGPTSQPPIDFKQPVHVRQGDVVCVPPNTEKEWKNSKSTTWYAYVQSTHEDKSGNDKLEVIWLYEPSDTTIGDAFYPFKNELFFSEHCDCGKKAIPLDAVIAKLDVSWFVSDPEAAPGYFVRYKYHRSEDDDNYSFTTLRSEDFNCSNNHLTSFEEILNKYKTGETVLVHIQERDDFLQPARIVSINPNFEKISLRKLLRSSTFDVTAPPNELQESTAIEPELLLHAERIARHCKVERFATRAQVHSPYNRDGLGDYFYILREDSISSQSTLATPPESEDEGENPDIPGIEAQINQKNNRPLVGLDLFCGGGNFGRGLEEAGMVKMQYAVDWDAVALHSYRANVDKPTEVKFFLGSVNEYLRRALHETKCPLVAFIGHPEFISAGSPCPGFSSMQPDKQSYQSLQFASMVASVVAFVDCYSPQYFVLENVVPMTYAITVDGHRQNVFSQIIGSLVALGYQVQQFLGDAWSVGSCEQRSRVFIVASTPGTVPLSPPPRTHAHPGKMVMRSLGKTSNGLPFGIRRFGPTPFPGVSARAATSDLPDIGDSLPQICPQFPDHRTFADQSLTTRQRLARIPIHPYGMGIQQAVHNGDITSGEAYEWTKNCKGERGKKTSRSYTRVRPDELFPTIMTALRLQCAFNGKVIHWDQHRSLSNMEARRGQGVLDHEVIVGLPSQQLKIVGNSVERKLAFTTGIAFNDSRKATLRQERKALGDDVHDTDDVAFEHPHPPELRSNDDPPPVPMQTDSEPLEAEGSQKFKAILRDLIERHNSTVEDVEDLDMDMLVGQRWAGDSPADAIKVRRRMSELESLTLRAKRP